MSRFSGSSSNSLSRNSTKASSSSVSSNNQEASTNSPVTTQSPATPTVPAVTTAPSGIQLSDLQNIISGLAVNQVKKDETNIDLASVINSDALKTLLENKDFMDKVKELLPDTNEANLPQQTLSEQVASTIESVQFKSALSTFNSALQSGLLGPLIQQFNLSEACVEAANKGGKFSF
ncbi:hypothetical protein RND71_043706 [Anisodus tanguticus]|uniref:DEUBAD domain-containing protein n=1 Tax=Anisodus tanguticus TaxID=243964 RepID=A0AAE1URC1_9SOLA|nr:hypothetical protein RND71_043706 [Anisodus tanguticus]